MMPKTFVKWSAPAAEGERARDYWTVTQFYVSAGKYGKFVSRLLYWNRQRLESLGIRRLKEILVDQQNGSPIKYLYKKV